MSCEYIEDLAETIWIDIGEPTSMTPGAIAAQLTSDAYMGKLSALLGVCFETDDSGCPVPALTNPQMAILGEVFKIGYWGRLVATTNGAGGVQLIAELREADSVVRYQTNSERAKAYLQMQKDAQTNLDALIRSYFDLTLDSDVPRSVDYPGFI